MWVIHPRNDVDDARGQVEKESLPAGRFVSFVSNKIALCHGKATFS